VKKVNSRFLSSQGKVREFCTTIQYYDWVSNNGKLNANGWSDPLTETNQEFPSRHPIS